MNRVCGLMLSRSCDMCQHASTKGKCCWRGWVAKHKVKRAVLYVRVKPELAKRVRDVTKRERRSFNEQMTIIVERGLEVVEKVG